MRIRLPFAAAFVCLLLLAGYAGLSTLQLPQINDKLLHGVVFFLLTTAFYWILDTTRRRTLNLSLISCTFILGIGSEFLQGAIPNNGRDFDLYDIAANITGSLAALGISSWYHKRMLERKRKARGYGLVPGEDGEDVDVELGEGVSRGENEAGLGAQDSGIVPGHVAPALSPTLDEEVENWDENEWDEDEPLNNDGEQGKPKSADTGGA